MPEDVLDELDAAAPVAGSLENIEDLIRVFVREVSYAVSGMMGSTEVFENIWRRMVLDVASGRAGEMHALRPRLLMAFEKRLDLLKRAYDRAAWLYQLGRAEAPNPDVLLPEIAGMARLKVALFDHWRTVEDLERLAVEHYPISQAQLERVAAAHAPPPEWYAGEEEQLFQE